MSKYKLKNKPFEITNGSRRLERCWETEEGAKFHLKFIKKLSKRLRKVDIYANFNVMPRTDGVYGG